MRNQFKGECYVCHKEVKPGDGFFEREAGKFRVRHVWCESNHYLKRRSKAKQRGHNYENPFPRR